MKLFKEKCIELRRQDYTLLEISRITGRPKTSVYFHIKDIDLSTAKQNSIKLARIARIVPFASIRKGKSSRQFKEFNKWNGDLVNLVSHFVFDGEIKNSGCVYNNRNQALLDRVEASMKLVYKFAPTYYINHVTGVKRISYFNVALAAYIRKKSVDLLRNICHSPKPLKKEFLKSFFDDEGCIDFRIKKNMRRVRGYQKNVEILVIVQKLLNNFDIKSAIHQPNEIVVMGKENLEKFQKEIGFSHGVYINGNRSNSIWKKSLEKRYILDRAIKSFKM